LPLINAQLSLLPPNTTKKIQILSRSAAADGLKMIVSQAAA
jgi:hypothetical protein